MPTLTAFGASSLVEILEVGDGVGNNRIIHQALIQSWNSNCSKFSVW